MDGAMSAGEGLEEEGFVCYLTAVALIGLRGHGRGGKRRRGEQSLVAAALFKIGAGVPELVREVGVALLLCLYSGRRDMCVCCLCFVSVFTLSKSDASLGTQYPECLYHDHCRQCRAYFLETNILFTGSNNTHLQHFVFFIPFVILAPLSRSLSVVTQIRGHIAGPPPPSPLRHVPLFLSREEASIFFPRRLASNEPRF